MLNDIRSFNASRATVIGKCMSELNAKYTPHSLYIAGFPGHERDPHSADGLLTSMVYKDVILMGYQLDQRMMVTYIQNACNQYYALKRDDAEAHRLDVLKKIRQEIVGKQ